MVVNDPVTIKNVTLKGIPTIEEVILARQLDEEPHDHPVEGKFQIEIDMHIDNDPRYLSIYAYKE